MDRMDLFALPDMRLNPGDRVWIYGINDLARSYYEQICSRYGEHIVNGFIQTLGQPALYMGKKVFGLSEKLEISVNDKFLVATQQYADIAVSTLLYYYGVRREQIVCRREWTSSLPPGGKPILVHQFGKVGSTSIWRKLKRLNLEAYHTHVLNAERMNRWVREVQKVGAVITLFHLNSLCICKWALNRKWDIISGVRDPLQRNISWFFEQLYYYIPDYRRQLEMVTDSAKLADRWFEVFFERFPHEEIFHWFDAEMKDNFGIDVFEHPFDKFRGYGFYEGNGHRLLVLQFERLPNLSTVIRDFLGLPEFELQKENVTETREYGHVYKEFLRRIRFDDSFLDRMYNNRFSRHFYTDEDIETFRRKWSKQS